MNANDENIQQANGTVWHKMTFQEREEGAGLDLPGLSSKCSEQHVSRNLTFLFKWITIIIIIINRLNFIALWTGQGWQDLTSNAPLTGCPLLCHAAPMCPFWDDDSNRLKFTSLCFLMQALQWSWCFLHLSINQHLSIEPFTKPKCSQCESHQC